LELWTDLKYVGYLCSSLLKGGVYLLDFPKYEVTFVELEISYLYVNEEDYGKFEADIKIPKYNVPVSKMIFSLKYNWYFPKGRLFLVRSFLYTSYRLISQKVVLQTF